MIAIVLIAIAAGSASALMFASIISGALISLLLFYLAPLPLMVAALGWGPLSATIGGIVAATGLGAIFGLPYCIAFAVTISALVEFYAAEYARSAALFEESIALCRELGEHSIRSAALVRFGDVRQRQGLHAEAKARGFSAPASTYAARQSP